MADYEYSDYLMTYLVSLSNCITDGHTNIVIMIKNYLANRKMNFQAKLAFFLVDTFLLKPRRVMLI